METKILTGTELAVAAELLQAGELVAFPTETVYGLGANALNEAAVKKVYQAKGRPSDNPLIVHVDSVAMMAQYSAKLPEEIYQLAEKFWPGPLTIIVKAKPATFSKVLTGGLDTVAFRVPANDKTLALIKRTKLPLVGPSANTSGRPSPTNAQHVYHDLQGKIAGILDDGATQIGVESTVVDMSTYPADVATILRPGAISQADLAQVLGEVAIDAHLVAQDQAPKAPGMKYKHYAPQVPVVMVADELTLWQAAIKDAQKAGKKVGIFANERLVNMLQTQVADTFSFGANQVEAATKELFAGLRSLDTPAVDVIFAQTFPSVGLGSAYMNRLQKAANQKYFKN